MRKHRLALTAAAVSLTSVFSAAGAAAQSAGSGYVQFGAGPFIPVQDRFRSEADIFGDIVEVEAAIDYATGVGAFGLYGYRMSRAFAVEAEYAFRQSDVNAVTLLSGGAGLTEPAEGSTRSSAYLVNGVLHAPVPLPVKPYIGAGAGYATLDPAGGGEVDGALAYQVKAGATLPIFIGELGVEAKYFAAADFEAAGDMAAARIEFGGVDVLGTFRYNF